FIVDFLFLNLIALTRWERAEPARTHQPPVNEISANTVSRDQDLVEAMRQSLADEQLARQALEQKLSSADTTLSARERSLGQLQAEGLKLTAQLVDTQKAQAERQRQALATLERQQTDAQKQIESLTVAVAVGKRDNQQLASQAEDLQKQVEGERTERIKVEQSTQQLAQGVGALAQNSGELTKEIRDSRPISANVLFNDFLANRVRTVFTATR